MRREPRDEKIQEAHAEISARGIVPETNGGNADVDIQPRRQLSDLPSLRHRYGPGINKILRSLWAAAWVEFHY